MKANRIRDLTGIIVLAALLPLAAQAQTLGTKIGADNNKETWTLDIAASDTTSDYFVVPSFTETIMISFPAMTGTIINFEAALDSSVTSGGGIPATFRRIRLNTAASDSIVSTPGAFVFNATTMLKGAFAARIVCVTAQGSAAVIRVFIRKKLPGR